MSQEDQAALAAALRLHPEWRDAYERGSLPEQDVRHLLLHEAVERMLARNTRLAAVTTEAEQRGVDHHDVRHCLCRALLAGMWDFTHEGAGHDADGVAERFVRELEEYRR